MFSSHTFKQLSIVRNQKRYWRNFWGHWTWKYSLLTLTLAFQLKESKIWCPLEQDSQSWFSICSCNTLPGDFSDWVPPHLWSNLGQILMKMSFCYLFPERELLKMVKPMKENQNWNREVHFEKSGENDHNGVKPVSQGTFFPHKLRNGNSINETIVYQAGSVMRTWFSSVSPVSVVTKRKEQREEL